MRGYRNRETPAPLNSYSFTNSFNNPGLHQDRRTYRTEGSPAPTISPAPAASPTATPAATPTTTPTITPCLPLRLSKRLHLDRQSCLHHLPVYSRFDDKTGLQRLMTVPLKHTCRNRPGDIEEGLEQGGTVIIHAGREMKYSLLTPRWSSLRLLRKTGSVTLIMKPSDQNTGSALI